MNSGKKDGDDASGTGDLPIAALNAKCLLNQAVSQFEDRLEIALLGAVVTKDVTRFYPHSRCSFSSIEPNFGMDSCELT
jgi:hypothetical protein